MDHPTSASDKVEDYFTKDVPLEAINTLVKILQNATDIGVTEELQKLAISVKNSSWQTELEEKITTPKIFSWADMEKFISISELNDLFEVYSFEFPRSELFRQCGNNSFEHRKGLTLTMTKDEIKTLVANQPEFVACATTKRKSTETERRTMVFMDKKRPHWGTTMERVKLFAKKHRYNFDDIKELITDLSIVSYPDQARYFYSLSLEELTCLLCSKDPLEFENEKYLKSLESLVRSEGECLQSVMNQCQNLYKHLVSENDKPADISPDYKDPKYCETFMTFSLNCLKKFCGPKLQQQLAEQVTKARVNGRKVDFNFLLTSCLKAERADRSLMPTADIKLQYKHFKMANINQVTTINFEDEVHALHPLRFKAKSPGSDSDEESANAPYYTNNQQTQPPTNRNADRIPRMVVPPPLDDNYAKALNKANEILLSDQKVLFVEWCNYTIDQLVQPDSSDRPLNERLKTIIAFLKQNMPSEDFIAAIFASDAVKNANIDPNIFQRFHRINTLRSSGQQSASCNATSGKVYNANGDFVYDKLDPDQSRRTRRPNSFDRKYESRFEDNDKKNQINTNKSPDRNISNDRSRYRNRRSNRDYSRERSESMDYRRRNNYRSPYDPRRSRQDNSYEPRQNRRRQWSRSFSRDRTARRRTPSSGYRYSSTIRPRSVSARRLYPNMRPGNNCPYNYNPLSEKFCGKCNKNSHHPFDCAEFALYSNKLCANCEQGHHTAEECRQKNGFFNKPSSN